MEGTNLAKIVFKCLQMGKICEICSTRSGKLSCAPGRSVKHTPTWISNPEIMSSASVGLPVWRTPPHLLRIPYRIIWGCQHVCSSVRRDESNFNRKTGKHLLKKSLQTEEILQAKIFEKIITRGAGMDLQQSDGPRDDHTKEVSQKEKDRYYLIALNV